MRDVWEGGSKSDGRSTRVAAVYLQGHAVVVDRLHGPSRPPSFPKEPQGRRPKTPQMLISAKALAAETDSGL